MDTDLMKRMQALLAKFNELENRVTELQDKTAKVLHDFEAAVSLPSQPMHPLEQFEAIITPEPVGTI